MPGRRYAPKRRLIRRKRLARRPFKLVRRMPRGQPSVYSFKRSVFFKDNIIVNSGTDYRQGIDFAFNFLPAFNEFTALYDQYMIKKIVWKVIPKFTEALLNSGATTNGNLQQIHSAIDYDDNTNPTDVAQLTQYQSYKMTRGNQIHTRVLVPKIELTSNDAGQVLRSYQWIDSDNAGVGHRGIKVVIPAPSTANTQCVYDVLITYYFSCKNVN